MSGSIAWRSATAAAIVALCSAWACGDRSTDGADCTYGGKIYHHGERFAALDRCNSCECDNGSVQCTLMACARCYWGNDVYLPGETVDTAGGCQVCSCGGRTGFDCSMQACEPAEAVSEGSSQNEMVLLDAGSLEQTYPTLDGGEIDQTTSSADAGDIEQASSSPDAGTELGSPMLEVGD